MNRKWRFNSTDNLNKNINSILLIVYVILNNQRFNIIVPSLKRRGMINESTMNNYSCMQDLDFQHNNNSCIQDLDF